MQKEVNLEIILWDVFDPSPQDCTTTTQDIQLALTLNPDLNRIKTAMMESCRQVLKLAAKNARGWDVDEQSIIDTIKQVKQTL